MKLARSIKLFRPNLKNFTAYLNTVSDASTTAEDESWVWVKNADVRRQRCNAVSMPKSFNFMPDNAKSSGSAYARWSILTAALSFQLINVDDFLLKLQKWWGENEHPEKALPETDEQWSELFDSKEKWFAARKAIFTEITTSKSFQAIGQAWESKLSMGRPFNLEDATRLAKVFPKSFADPFLLKAQRAVWQFTQVYVSQGQKIDVSLSNTTNPDDLLSMMESGYADVHEVLKECLKSGGLLRDEIKEKAVRSFLIKNNTIFKNIDDGTDCFEIKNSFIEHQTTDY